MGSRSQTKARKSNYIFEYRVTLLGGSRTGKTAFIKRLTEGQFSERYKPTIEDHFQHVVNHKGLMCVCLLIDTSGSSDFPAMKTWTISKGNAFIVAYSIADKKSFDHAKSLIVDIKKVKGSSEYIKIMLIGTHADNEEGRKVNRDEGLEYAQEISNDNVTCDFVEVSSKEDRNVSEAFHGLLNLFPELSQQDHGSNSPEETPSPRKTSFTRTLSIRRKKKLNKNTSDNRGKAELLRQTKSDENILSELDSSLVSWPPLHGHRTRTLSDTPIPPKHLQSKVQSSGSRSSSDNDLSPPESPKNSTGVDPLDLRSSKRQNSAKEKIRKTSSILKSKLDNARRILAVNSPRLTPRTNKQRLQRCNTIDVGF